MRMLSPSLKLTPAALDAMTTEKGLTVENMQPMELPHQMAAMATMASKPALMKTGIMTG